MSRSAATMPDRIEDAPELLTPAEAAAYLRCHPNTVSQMIARGDLDPCVRRIGTRARLSRDALAAWIRGTDHP